MVNTTKQENKKRFNFKNTTVGKNIPSGTEQSTPTSNVNNVTLDKDESTQNQTTTGGVKQDPAAACRAKGGFWTGTECILPGSDKAKQVSGQSVSTSDIDTSQRLLQRQFLKAQRESSKILKDGGKEAVKPLTPQEMAQQEALLGTAEDVGVFEDRPENVELDVTQEELEEFDDGAFLKAARKASPITGIIVDVLQGKLGLDNPTEMRGLIQNPETRREIMLNELSEEYLNESRTASQRVGAALEPFLGDLKVADVDIGKYVDKFARMPKQEAEEIVEQLKIKTSIASGLTDAASQGEIGNPQEVLQDLDQYEKDITVAEARLKRLILESAELRANPEQVNIIEAELLDARETLSEARARAAEGALLTPPEENLYLRLQQLRNK